MKMKFRFELSTVSLCVCTGWAKMNQTVFFFRVDNFATVSDRKACSMSKVSEFCPEGKKNLHVNEFKYYLPNLHKSSLHLKLCCI